MIVEVAAVVVALCMVMIAVVAVVVLIRVTAAAEKIERLARLVDEIQEKTSELLASGKAMAEERKRDLQEAIAIAKRALDEERVLLRRIRDRSRAGVNTE